MSTSRPPRPRDVSSPPAVDQAADALRALIARGRYQPGDRLPPERELAESLGLSRPTVRESIRRLVEAGLLLPRRGSGTYVADVDLDAVFSVRLQLEPYAARLAAARRTDAQAKHLGSLVRRLSTQLDRPAEFAATDELLHDAVARAAGNPVLVDVLSRLGELAKLSRAVTSPERDARVAGRHHMRQLVRAIHAREPDAAAQAMEDHLAALRQVARSAQEQRLRDRALGPVGV